MLNVRNILLYWNFKHFHLNFLIIQFIIISLYLFKPTICARSTVVSILAVTEVTSGDLLASPVILAGAAGTFRHIYRVKQHISY